MKAAVVLAGCGFLDGAEIREAVLSLLYLDENNIDAQCFALDAEQHHTINHLNQSESDSPRNILEESARIARGNIQPLNTLNADNYDMLVLPGGFGVAKNYADLAFKGSDCTVHPEYAGVIQSFHNKQKTIVAMCIAPAVVAAALKGEGATLTIGDDEGTANAIQAFGNQHQNAATSEAITDVEHRIVTCSAYMREDRIADVAKGIEEAIIAGIALANKEQKDAA